MTAPIDLAVFDGPLLVPGLARWLGVDTDTPPQEDTDTLATVTELTARIADLEQQIAAGRERNHRLRAAGYIDRTGLEA